MQLRIALYSNQNQLEDITLRNGKQIIHLMIDKDGNLKHKNTEIKAIIEKFYEEISQRNLTHELPANMENVGSVENT